MLPVALTGAIGRRSPNLSKMLDYLKSRVEVELRDLDPVAVLARRKEGDSVLQKLQTGRYARIDDLDDLVGIKVVTLSRHQVEQAQSVLLGSNLQTSSPNSIPHDPTDFRYHEPKLNIAPPPDYLERNPDLYGVAAEVQFTTALQHALDMATHDFDYKGRRYSWGAFRLVAQMRATLELLDTIIDDLDSAGSLVIDATVLPHRFGEARDIGSALEAAFKPDALPKDMRRMVDTVLDWCGGAGLPAAQLGDLLARHDDLVGALSIDATSAVLGALLRERGDTLLSGYHGYLVISAELASSCREADAVPADRRVALD